jgi:hypothetical protein
MGIWPVMIGHDKTTTIAHIYNSTQLSGSGGVGASIGAFGRNSTQGLKLGSGGGGTGGATSVFKTLPASISEIYHAFSYETAALPVETSLRTIADWRDAGNIQLRLILASDGTLRLYRGVNTLLAVVPNFAMLSGVTYHIEWYGLIHASNGGYGVWINEAEKILVTSGANTQGFAGNLVSEVRLANGHQEVGGGIGAAQISHFDDHIIDIERIFDLNVREDLPDGNGGVDQWTASGAATTREAVDEAPPDDDTSYAHTSTVGHRSRWTYPPIPSTAEVKALGSSIRAKKTDPGTALVKGLWFDGLAATEHEFDEKAPSQDAYEYHDSAFKENPATTNPFTAAEINAGELGVERTG